jgi:benzoylformate decarboxylase
MIRAMPFISGKQAFLEVLRQEGVSLMFGNPGTTELPLMDALVREREIRYILALQEAVAVAMADGYAQASGALAAVNVHVSPGLGNAMGMLYNACKANAPLLLTAGQHDQSFNATEPILWSDLPPVAAPYVKWSSEVRRIEDLPRLVHRAAKTALAHPAGPAFLSLPVDVLNAERDIDLGSPTRVAPRIVGDRVAVGEAARLLARGERPLLIAGDAVADSDALAELVELAELLGAPVLLEGLASRCTFPFTHPQYSGALPRLPAQIRAILMRHDVVFSAGANLFTLSLPDDVDPMPSGLQVIHLDTDPWELGKNYPAGVAILGDPKATLPDLLAALEARMTAAARGRARERLEATRAAKARHADELRARARAEAGRTPITPLALIAAVADALPPEAVVVDESISSGAGLRTLLRSDDARSFYGLRGGGIGWGLPAAIGVKLALPARPVVGLIGDGSAMYTCQALWTAARYRVGVTFVILNNSSYRILKQRIHAMKGLAAQADRYVAMDLDDPRVDFVRLAESLGVPAERIEKVTEVGPALGRALAAGGPTLLDVELDRSFKPA